MIVTSIVSDNLVLIPMTSKKRDRLCNRIITCKGMHPPPLPIHTRHIGFYIMYTAYCDHIRFWILQLFFQKVDMTLNILKSPFNWKPYLIPPLNVCRYCSLIVIYSFHYTYRSSNIYFYRMLTI